MNCRRCGVVNADEMEFCRQCGASLHWHSVIGPTARNDRQGVVGLVVAAVGLVVGLLLFNSSLAPSLLNATSASSPVADAVPATAATPTARTVAMAAPNTPIAGASARAAETPPPAKLDAKPPTAAPTPTKNASGAALPRPTATPTRAPAAGGTATPAPAATPTEVMPAGSEEAPPEEESGEPALDPVEEPDAEPIEPEAEEPPGEGEPDSDTPDVPLPVSVSPNEAATQYLNATAPVYARGRDSFNRFADQWNGSAGFAARLLQDPGDTALAASVTQAVQQARNDVNAAIIAIQQRQPPSTLTALRNRLTQALTTARGALLVAGNSASSATQVAAIEQATENVNQASQELARAAGELETARAQYSTR